MENESHGHYLGAHLDSEDSLQRYNLNALKSLLLRYHKDWLQLLQLEGEDGLVVVGDPAVHRHDHAVGHDGDDYQPLKRGPSHEPDKQTPETIKKSI